MVATAGETHTTAVGIMAGTTAEDFAVIHIMAVVLIMAGTTVDTMVETDVEMDLIIMAGTMAGVEIDMLLIMEGITLMEVEDTSGQIDIIEQQIALDKE